MTVLSVAFSLVIGFGVLLLVISRSLHLFPNPLRFYLFLGYVGATLVLSTIWSAFALSIFTLFGRHDLAQHTTSRLWWYITAPLVGIRLEIEGEETLIGWGGEHGHKGPCVFVINHQSEIDVLIASRVCHQQDFVHVILRS